MRDGQRWYERIRSNDGTLPAYAWPGGYPVVYVAADGGIFCPVCVNQEEEVELLEPEELQQPVMGWEVVGYQVHWEGAPEVCCHCGDEIQSAYGDPDADRPAIVWEPRCSRCGDELKAEDLAICSRCELELDPEVI
jgi:hypothetical protein